MMREDIPAIDDLPEVVVQPVRRKVSLVWLIPIIAASVGAWLIYRAVTEKGPEVTISFETALELTAGKTKIKYKEVELGKVVKILLSPDQSHVLVKAQLDKQAEGLLSKNTRFWVVRARVAATEVTGLGTLFSGAYIALDPGEPGEFSDQFKGLEKPPLVTSGTPGRHFTLMADQRGSLDIGSPVYYRQIKAGEVVDYELGPMGRGIRFKIFIRAPYHEYVFNNTRFWNISGFDLSIDTHGIKLRAETLSTLLMGGIAYHLPENVSSDGRPEEKKVYTLYPNLKASQVKHYAFKTRWQLNFQGSVRGLAVGAPVEFRGIPIGKVVDISVEYNEESAAFNIPVLIEVEPERLISNRPLSGIEDLKLIVDQLVAKGLRAQLKTGNLLTGQQLIEFDIYQNVPVSQADWAVPIPRLPTMPGRIETVGNQMLRLLDKLESMPLGEILADIRTVVQNIKDLSDSPALPRTLVRLNTVLDNLKGLVDSFQSKVTPEMIKTLQQAQHSLNSTRAILDTDSDLQYSIRSAMEEISKAARSLHTLTDYIERHPEAFIFGRERE